MKTRRLLNFSTHPGDPELFGDDWSRADERGRSFREQFDTARRHVGNIDRHEPFAWPGIAEVLEKIEKENVVFEFTFTGIDEWEEKIAMQKKALDGCLWPNETGISADLEK